MYCHNCGKEIDDKAVICVNCGVAVGETKQTDSASMENMAIAPKFGNPVAMVGFVMSLVSALFLVITCFSASGVILLLSFLLGVSAIPCSAVGMNRAKHKNARYHGFAVAGLAVGIVVVSFVVLIFIIAIAIASSMIIEI